jgi:hypothetical protein
MVVFWPWMVLQYLLDNCMMRKCFIRRITVTEKGGFGIVVLAGCDVKCRFIVASCNHSGSTNDIIAWQHMDLYEAVEIDGMLPSKFFFIGDEAFTNTNQFLSPWPGECCTYK